MWQQKQEKGKYSFCFHSTCICKCLSELFSFIFHDSKKQINTNKTTTTTAKARTHARKCKNNQEIYSSTLSIRIQEFFNLPKQLTHTIGALVQSFNLTWVLKWEELKAPIVLKEKNLPAFCELCWYFVRNIVVEELVFVISRFQWCISLLYGDQRSYQKSIMNR